MCAGFQSEEEDCFVTCNPSFHIVGVAQFGSSRSESNPRL
jgi:hypothetical protein